MNLWCEPQSIFEPFRLQIVDWAVPRGETTPQTTTLPAGPEEQQQAAERLGNKIRFMTGTTVQFQPWWEVCSALLRSLLKEKESKLFRTPVDYIKHNLPLYPQYIRHPMDLGTIDRFLHGPQCLYENPDDFVCDVRLVFRNAYVFNPEGNFVRTLALKLSQKFEAELYAYHQQVSN